MNKFRLIVLACILLFISKVLYGQEDERWYRVSIGGNSVGYLLEKNDSSGERNTSLTEMNISIGRLGSNVKMETKTIQIEKDGQLIGINAEMYFSNEKKVESVQVMNDHLIIESQGIQRSIPLNAKLTGPKLLQELVSRQIENKQESFHYTTYSAELGIYLNGTHKFTGTENMDINGKEFNAIIVEESFQELPYSRKKWLTQNGRLLKSTEPSPFGDMEVVWTNKENALNALNNSVDLPEEQYGRTMAYSNYRLSHPRNLSSTTIRITQKRPEFGFPDFSGEYQRVVSKSDNEIILQIDKPDLGHKQHQQNNLDEYLAPNAFLDNSDELLIKKTREVIGNETDDWEKVKLITDWVRKNMSFDPGIALADSREVFRDLKGTCVSYALLTSTMSKAAGIPARFLMGYVYVDGAWGGHAWSEVIINGQWIPIDAAVPNNTYIADAARFFMVRSSLKTGMGAANIAGMQLFGNIDVKILEYGMNEETFTATEEPYIIKDEIYSNPGLNFNMRRLEGFDFSDFDKFYPESTILKQNKVSSEIVVEHWTYGTAEDTEYSMNRILSETKSTAKPHPLNTQMYNGYKTTGSDKSVAIIKDDSKAFFSLTVTGSDHRELLAKALEAIRRTVN